MFVFNPSAIFNPNYLTMGVSNFSLTQQTLAQQSGVLPAVVRFHSFALAQATHAEFNQINQGLSNLNNGVSLVQVAENGINLILANLSALNAVAVQASSSTASSSDLISLQTEYADLIGEINQLANTTTFNGQALLNSTSSLYINAGAYTSTDSLAIGLTNLTTGSQGLGLCMTDVSTSVDATSAIAVINNAINIANASLQQFNNSQTSLNTAITTNSALATTLNLAANSIQSSDYTNQLANLFTDAIINRTAAFKVVQASRINRQYVLYLLTNS